MAVRVIQVTNVSTHIQKDQVRSLFSQIGRIEEIQLYPESETLRAGIGASVAYIKYERVDAAQAALQLNNTMFIDKSIICNPVKSGKIPHETEAVKYCAPLNSDINLMPGGSSWPSTVINRIHGTGPDAYVETIDPALVERGLLQYPSLPATLDPVKIEEIRRTVYVSNIGAHVSLENLNELFDQVGEVRFIRFAGDETAPTKDAYIEFSEQHHVVRALCLNGLQFVGTTLK